MSTSRIRRRARFLVTPADYDAWYQTARGRWIGDTEFRLIARLLGQCPGRQLLDVGCGTGWFTRHFAAIPGLKVTGLDCDLESLSFAHAHDSNTFYVQGNAQSLPFADASFDLVVSIAALCFIANWPSALKEMIRVTRTRFVIATLNRTSLLFRQKGRGNSSGAYRGAHWHTHQALRSTFAMLPVTDLRFHSAIFCPTGSRIARLAEGILPNRLGCGALLVVSGRKLRP